MLRERYFEARAPSKVAADPAITSHKRQPVIEFEIIQPIVRPGIAAAVKNGSIVRASLSLICITPFARPNIEEISVSITYSAAISDASHKKRVFVFIGALHSFIYSEDGFELTLRDYNTEPN